MDKNVIQLLMILIVNVPFSFVLITEIEVTNNTIIPTILLFLNMLLGIIIGCLIIFYTYTENPNISVDN